MDRNPISDLAAVAAIPDLERLADVLLAGYSTSRSRQEVMANLVFLAGRHVFHSGNACDSALLSTPLWDWVRDSAMSVGRELPSSPPTFDRLRHFRDGLPEDAIDRLAVAFTEIAVPLAQDAGLLDPSGSSRWDDPAPGNVIYGDGSVFRSWSGVTVDADGEVRGSRARTTPRIPAVYQGKDDGNPGLSGLPISVVGCHGRERWQRVVLGVQMFFDRDELGASMDIIKRVRALSGLESRGVV